jgi:hypothetical protein
MGDIVAATATKRKYQVFVQDPSVPTRALLSSDPDGSHRARGSARGQGTESLAASQVDSHATSTRRPSDDAPATTN